jgi:hypothetical protein
LDHIVGGFWLEFWINLREFETLCSFDRHLVELLISYRVACWVIGIDWVLSVFDKLDWSIVFTIKSQSERTGAEYIETVIKIKKGYFCNFAGWKLDIWLENLR